MTRTLLVAIGSLKGGGLVVSCAALLGGLLLPIALIVDGISLLQGPVRLGDRAVCPQGHPLELRGAWRCACGFVAVRHVLEPCPNPDCDAEPPVAVRCACGLSVTIGGAS